MYIAVSAVAATSLVGLGLFFAVLATEESSKSTAPIRSTPPAQFTPAAAAVTNYVIPTAPPMTKQAFVAAPPAPPMTKQALVVAPPAPPFTTPGSPIRTPPPVTTPGSPIRTPPPVTTPGSPIRTPPPPVTTPGSPIRTPPPFTTPPAIRTPASPIRIPPPVTTPVSQIPLIPPMPPLSNPPPVSPIPSTTPSSAPSSSIKPITPPSPRPITIPKGVPDLYGNFYRNIISKSQPLTNFVNYAIMLGNDIVQIRKPSYVYKNFYISEASNIWLYIFVPSDNKIHPNVSNAKNNIVHNAIIGSHYTLGYKKDCPDFLFIHKTGYFIDPKDPKHILQREPVKECNLEIREIAAKIVSNIPLKCKICDETNKTISEKNTTFDDSFGPIDSANIKEILMLGTTWQTGGNKILKKNKTTNKICSDKVMKQIYKFIYNKKPKSATNVELVFHQDKKIVILYHYPNNKVTIKNTTCDSILKKINA
jgi:hypothetical protein